MQWTKDAKEVIRSCKSKDRQCKGQKDKRTNNDQQNTSQKIKYGTTRTQLESECEFMCPVRMDSYVSLMELFTMLIMQCIEKLCKLVAIICRQYL